MPIPTNVVVMHIIAFILNIACGVLGIAIPYLIGRNNRYKAAKALSYLNCAAGGVLLGVSMVHIMPEAGESLNPVVGGFPLSYYITFAALIIMLTLIKAGGHDHEHVTMEFPDIEANAYETQGLIDGGKKEVDESESHSHEHSHEHTEKKSLSNVIVLLIGLMIHDLSEGISLGLCTEFMDVFTLFLAIFLHKWCEYVVYAIVGIRYGLTFKQNMAYLVPLCLATPIAQIIAFSIIYFTTGEGEIPTAGLVVYDIFLSFAAGTFIGIAFEEILEVEMTHKDKPKTIMLKMLTLLGGFSFIAISGIVEFIVEKDED